ncbi:C4-dicarboxylate TRAP transporter substrate-binding protein [Maritimibacter sp. DP1N21-5]|uniref:C4-dicarboxylate TRAP transporter substrate-binding protein n=1 Tax=Maritimibacter sp. DP1N21-5 TaxID=2836867 RepID=UPI001C4381BF|nr:C4-dicarboxylate TRAP transporter substrate-binding protein [Maritimibacter sp. DP1N21-5]MBV7407435.1 C4-dicarboxylate TRAP transporter substrate-binding protein [Maritimibacter sp. DP1N21-5]
MKSVKTALRLGAFGFTAVAMTTPLVAQDLRYAVGLPESSYNYDGALAFAEELKETADMDVKVFSMSLLSLGEMLGGVRDGLADVGYTLFPYFPAEFSELNLAADLGMLATSGTQATYAGPAMIGASMEYIMLNCPDCQEQLKGLNTVYLSGGAAIDYGFVCNKPVATIADLSGMKVRTGAADAGRFVEHFGGTRVALSGNEIYDALSTGNVDCSANAAENLVGLRYIEIADYFLDGIPGSMFAGLGTANVNRDTWANLSEDQRRAVMHAGGTLALTSWKLNVERNAAGVQAFEEAGKTVFRATDEDKALITEFVALDQPVVREQYVNQYGLENVDEKIATITDLIEKWKGLTNETDGSIEALRQLYIDEIYSKVDVATYGVE